MLESADLETREFIYAFVICKYLRAAMEISFVLIVLPSGNKVFIIIIIVICIKQTAADSALMQ